MVFSNAVQWWQDSQLRILALASLSFQCFLSFFSADRKLHIHPLYRLSIWLSYLGGDALAIYALATLFNRHRSLQNSSVNSSHDLEVLWVPILLMHLGGQAGISAYNIEDNELWCRHIVTAVSQVAVSIYVFCSSWISTADKRLQAAAIVLFIPGIYKCFEKPYALKRCSFNCLVSSFCPVPRIETMNTEVDLEEYIQKTRCFVNSSTDFPTINMGEGLYHLRRMSVFDRLFVDLENSYTYRLKRLRYFWLFDDKVIYELLHNVLHRTFVITYSKCWLRRGYHRSSCLMWSFTLVLPIVPICLFHSSHKEAYRGSDITVTFLLLYITYFLEIIALVALEHSSSYLSDKVTQHNLIGFVARNKRQTNLRIIAEYLHCKDLLDEYWCMILSDSSSRAITSSVRAHIKDGWTNYMLDAESYRKLSDIRGHWTLERNGCEQVLGEILEKPFDESILLWHVATDFCFHHNATPSNREVMRQCREISDYMVHLLFANPEMLMPGSRRTLLTSANTELEAMLQGVDVTVLDETELTLQIFDKAQSGEGFIHKAWIFAKELMQIGDKQKMWSVIRGVWVEMLCYSAGRCRGYLHAKSLGAGGECLTLVALLMSHAGLETFAERRHRVQLRLTKEERVNIARNRLDEAARNEAARESAAMEVVVS
ncbi:hypothetical protein EJB05_09802, partial [Eragrostis curvula]